MFSIGSGIAKDWYDRLASQYETRWSTYLDRSCHQILHSRPWSPQERILDVACGTGRFLEKLSAKTPGVKAVGVDVSPGMLDVARAKGLPSSIQWIEAEASRLPFPDASFDAAICASALHYFQEPKRCFGEIRRVLRPGGRLVLVDWCGDGLWMKAFGWSQRRRNPALHRIYGLEGARELMERAGFTVNEARRFKAGALWKLMLLRGESRD